MGKGPEGCSCHGVVHAPISRLPPGLTNGGIANCILIHPNGSIVHAFARGALARPALLLCVTLLALRRQPALPLTPRPQLGWRPFVLP
jgi:hypothetical protein